MSATKSFVSVVMAVRMGGALVLALVPGAEVVAQGLPTSLTVTSQYPRSASQAVLSEPGSATLHPGDDLAFVGLGGQVGVVKANGPASGNLTYFPYNSPPAGAS